VSLILIFVELCFDEVQLSIAIDSYRINGTTLRMKFTRENQETNVFVNLVQWNHVGVFVDVLLKFRFVVEAGTKDAFCVLAVLGDDKSHTGWGK
jgi:hypothetical protein